MKHPLIAFINSAFESTEELAGEYPLPQTQALSMIRDEMDAWTEKALNCLGSSDVPCLKIHRDWVDGVQTHVFRMRDALEKREPTIINCRLNADDPLLQTVLALLDSCPNAEVIMDGLENKALAEALVLLTDFWIEHISQLLLRLLAHATGGGDVLAVLKRQDHLKQPRRWVVERSFGWAARFRRLRPTTSDYPKPWPDFTTSPLPS